MNNMKVAALTGTLLARKGTAMPSAFAPPPEPPAPAPAAAPARPQIPPRREPPPAAPRTAVTRAQAARAAAARPKLDSTGRVKLSLRLTPDLHLKLKLVAAFRRESAQKLLVAAMERHLDRIAPNAAREEYAWMAETDDELPVWPMPASHASFDMTG